MPEQNKIKPVEKTVLYVVEKKPYEFIHIMCLLDTYIKQNRKVAPVVVERLLNLFLYEEDDITDLLMAGIRERAHQLLDSLKLRYETKVESPKVYIGHPKIRYEEGKLVISFYDFVYLFDRIIPFDGEEKTLKILADKKSFVRLVYTSLYYYLNKVPEKNRPSMYKQAALVGVMAVACHLLPDESTFMNTSTSGKYYLEFLSDSTRHLCVSTKKRLDKRKKSEVPQVKVPGQEEWDFL